MVAFAGCAVGPWVFAFASPAPPRVAQNRPVPAQALLHALASVADPAMAKDGDALVGAGQSLQQAARALFRSHALLIANVDAALRALDGGGGRTDAGRAVAAALRS